MKPYTPRSDFCIVLRDFPILLLEVNSDKQCADSRRMLLQAASLYRLANVLINSKTPDFLVKAIYITEQFQAEEYTLFGTETQGENDHNQLVILRFRCPNR